MREGHFQVSRGMVVRGGRRQSICHPALHLSDIVGWGGEGDSGEGGGNGEDRGLGLVRVRLE